MIDLHRHLEAAPDIKHLPDFISRHKIDLPSNFEALKSALLFQSRPGDLVAFLQPYIDHIHKFFITHESVRDFTRLSIKKAHEEGIKYIELRFSPFYMSGIYAGPEQLDPETIINAVIQAKEDASSEFDIQVGLILIVGRELDISHGHTVIELAQKYREHICGVDLAGDEYNYPPDLFVDVFSRASSYGLPITIHAGEAGPSENVRFSIEELGATRIGHGVAAASDPEVIAVLRERGIPLELCPRSNWLTGAVKGDLYDHPVMSLHNAGVRVTLGTDDPMIQDTWLRDDLNVAQVLGATDEDVRVFQRTALECAFLPERIREELKEKMAG